MPARVTPEPTIRRRRRAARARRVALTLSLLAIASVIAVFVEPILLALPLGYVLVRLAHRQTRVICSHTDRAVERA